MSTKIRLKVGSVEVEYEGPEAFLNKKLPELISQLREVADEVPEDTEVASPVNPKNVGTLASFLKKTSVGTNATKRFLATSEWLNLKGKKELQTSDITTALRENQQTRLGNAAQCLNNNVNSGYCEKHQKNFYVTDEGRASLN